MAVKIRLKRMGAKKRPFYRVVVADARSPRDGRFIESVGYYDPLPEPATVRLDEERIRHWMATGARPSDSVRELLERQGVLAARPRPARAANQAEAAQAAPDAAAGADAAEAPAANAVASAVEEPEQGEAETTGAGEAAEADAVTAEAPPEVEAADGADPES